MQITNKYLDLLKTTSVVDVLEGTTQSGKTTTSVATKFLYMVKTTARTKHLIAADSLGTIVSNILTTGDLGLLEVYPDIEFFLNGNDKQKLPHLRIGEDIVFLVGYADAAKFKKVLGGQFGAVYIDEINIANMSFVRELFLPRFEYLMCTLNPDNPNKEIYEEIINRSRPIDKYKEQVPKEIMNELNKQKAVDNWHYWFFTFDDNPAMTEERKSLLMSSLLPETREYQTKILGKRTKGTGLIFQLPQDNIITEAQALEFKYKRFTVGIDTAYSRNSDDTFVFIFGGITTCNKFVVLEEKVLQNKGRVEPYTPSDIAVIATDFVINNQRKWGTVLSVFVDSADQATITECQKYKRTKGLNFNYINAYKKTKIIDRINLQNSWIATKHYLIVKHCKHHIAEHDIYSWKEEKDEPEDANDHTINASQYAWLPFKEAIGNEVKR